MFKKIKSLEPTLFKSPLNLMPRHAMKHYFAPKAWHNQLYLNETNNIEDETFISLSKSCKMCRDNSFVRQFVAIMVLKEGNRRSDEQMFEGLDFDLLNRNPLGLMNLSDQAAHYLAPLSIALILLIYNMSNFREFFTSTKRMKCEFVGWNEQQVYSLVS